MKRIFSGGPFEAKVGYARAVVAGLRYDVTLRHNSSGIDASEA